MKTIPPTFKKLKRAKAFGDLPYSKLFEQALMQLGSVILIIVFMSAWVHEVQQSWVRVLSGEVRSLSGLFKILGLIPLTTLFAMLWLLFVRMVQQHPQNLKWDLVEKREERRVHARRALRYVGWAVLVLWMSFEIQGISLRGWMKFGDFGIGFKGIFIGLMLSLSIGWIDFFLARRQYFLDQFMDSREFLREVEEERARWKEQKLIDFIKNPHQITLILIQEDPLIGKAIRYHPIEVPRPKIGECYSGIPLQCMIRDPDFGIPIVISQKWGLKFQSYKSGDEITMKDFYALLKQV